MGEGLDKHFTGRGGDESGEREELTQVTRREMKNSSATFVYPHAAVFASMAALFVRCWMIVARAGAICGAWKLGLIGDDPIVTEY